MHGIVFAELQKYTEKGYNQKGWDEVLRMAGLPNRVYLPIKEYPDSEIVSLMQAVSARKGLAVSTVLEDFGQFIAPSLVKLFGHLLQPEWRTLDVIENTETTVHSLIRAKNPGAYPPRLKTRRNGKHEVVLIYDSPRKMCALAVGIGKGLGKYFGESIVTTQTTCMNKGAARCEIVFRTFAVPGNSH